MQFLMTPRSQCLFLAEAQVPSRYGEKLLPYAGELLSVRRIASEATSGKPNEEESGSLLGVRLLFGEGLELGQQEGTTVAWLRPFTSQMQSLWLARLLSSRMVGFLFV